ncbi:unnamed protein product, partial [Diamesa hyperborea]
MAFSRISLFFACVIALFLCVDQGDAFSCFECKSNENKNCAVDKLSPILQVECGKNSDNIEITSCRKIIQYSNIPGEASRIIRECGIVGEGRFLNTCYLRPGTEGFKEEVCACDDTELCNGATNQRSGVTENAWAQVAEALNTKVEFCKKRWKSLRDTYIKYLRFEMQSDNDGEQCVKKHKPWVYYEDLNFLRQHVELFRGLNTYGELLEEEDDDGEEEALFEVQNESHEHLDDEPTYYIENEESLATYIVDNQSTVPKNEKTENQEPEEQDQKTHKDLPVQNNESNPSHSNPSAKSTKTNSVDPDERYLLSCLPAFKRFSPKQKAYVRMGIEKLFYEVEF